MTKKQSSSLNFKSLSFLHSCICCGVTCTTLYCGPCMANEQQESKGFFENDRIEILNRTVYEYRRYSKLSPPNDYAKEWGYGLMGTYTSGFTQGNIGFGVDSYAYLGTKLDSGGRADRIRLFPKESDHHIKPVFARIGAAGKIRLSSTTVKFGMMRPKTPIFSSSDTRLLPETSTGFQITSHEINDLSIQLGHFIAGADRNDYKSHNDLVVNYLDPSLTKGKSFNFIGGTYVGIPELSITSYIGHYQNNWNTYYLGNNYDHQFINNHILNINSHLYYNRNTGKSHAGKINNLTGSIAATYSIKQHHFTVAYQKVYGNTPFDYVTRGAIWLANSTQLTDFNGPHEQSWQAKYQLDLEIIGIKGLSLSAAYIRGTGIDGTKMSKQSGYAWLGYGKNGKHWESEFLLTYKIPKGIAKDLLITTRYDLHRVNAAQAELDTNHIRIGIEYPIVW